MASEAEDSSEQTPVWDCHAHMTYESFEGDLADVLTAAKVAGVGGVIGVSETVADARKLLEAAKEHDSLHICLGVHPVHASEAEVDSMIELVEEAADLLCGVGEVGLDYTPHVLGDDPEGVKAVQKAVLKKQVDLARRLELPLNVHSRGAGHHTISFLQECGAENVVMHAFDGKAKYAVAAVEASDYFFSVPPCIVRSPQLQKLVRRLPLSNLLLETDSPVLGPTREERNEPRNVMTSLQMIAEVKKLSLAEVARVTAENTMRLFPRLRR
eukprot:PLAT9474.3.p1 GENE.PLAT9474.3~~PLAT9474.3.p1  ORF type:complete len:270 (+),score=77.54 PLAT9474.3:49-858(+)